MLQKRKCHYTRIVLSGGGTFSKVWGMQVHVKKTMEKFRSLNENCDVTSIEI